MEHYNRDKSRGYLWALRVGTEMVSAIMAGLGAGFYLDRWLGTRPWLLLLFFLFGATAGFLNLYRTIRFDRNS